MKIVIADSYDDQCLLAYQAMLTAVTNKESPLICTTSGDSPKGVYKLMAQAITAGELDISKWKFISLDEWAGMNKSDEGSCGWHLYQQLYNHIDVPKQNLALFDGRANDLHQECTRIEQFIRDNGGISVAFVGLGLNGHIGMNEPGTPPEWRSHVAEIAEQTQEIGQKYFKEKTPLTRGITLGIDNILMAGKVILLVNGAHKAAIVKRILEEDITENIPATFLRQHNDCTLYLDAAAASVL